eukprot:1665635-Prymnesium_polylepis.2
MGRADAAAAAAASCSASVHGTPLSTTEPNLPWQRPRALRTSLGPRAPSRRAVSVATSRSRWPGASIATTSSLCVALLNLREASLTSSSTISTETNLNCVMRRSHARHLMICTVAAAVVPSAASTVDRTSATIVVRSVRKFFSATVARSRRNEPRKCSGAQPDPRPAL